MPSRPFTIFAVILWTHSNTFTSFLHLERQNCTQYLRWGFQHQCWVQIVSPFHQYVTLCLMTPEYSWIFFLEGMLLTLIELVIKQTLQFPFCRSALQALVPQSINSSRITLSGAELSTCYVNFIWLVIVQCSGLSWSFYKAFLSFPDSTASPILALSLNLFCVYTIPVSRLLIKILKRTGPKIEP